MTKEHLFRARAEWLGLDDGTGRVSAQGLDADIALPVEFGGSKVGTNAEELLLSALASCLSMTLAYVMEGLVSDNPPIEAEVEGTFLTGPLRLASVRVNLIVGPTDATLDVLKVAVGRAEARCMVSNIIRKSAPIEVTVQIR